MTTSSSPGAGSDLEPAPSFADGVPDGAQLWLIRHGETEWSRLGRHTGRTDVPLTPEGERQADGLRPMLAGLDPTLVLCSPRERARETALRAGLRVDEIDSDLSEWDYGAYEGRTSSDIRQEVPGWTLFTHGVPDGETAARVGARADRVLSRAAAALVRGTVVLVAHGHISRVIGARWIGLATSGGANLALGTAAASVLSCQYGQPVIERWNLPNP